jgi:hypothetical protein
VGKKYKSCVNLISKYSERDLIARRRKHAAQQAWTAGHDGTAI